MHSSRLGPDANDDLAEIPAVEQADERTRRLLQPLDDVFTVADASFAHPARHLRQKVGLTVAVVGDDEAANRHAVDQDRPEVGPSHRLRRIVLADEATERDAGAGVDEPEHGVEHGAADVLEVHVDPGRTGQAERAHEIAASMIHTRVEAERVHDEAALLLGARDADGPAPFELCDLTDHAAHGARRR